MSYSDLRRWHWWAVYDTM